MPVEKPAAGFFQQANIFVGRFSPLREETPERKLITGFSP